MCTRERLLVISFTYLIVATADGKSLSQARSQSVEELSGSKTQATVPREKCDTIVSSPDRSRAIGTGKPVFWPMTGTKGGVIGRLDHPSRPRSFHDSFKPKADEQNFDPLNT
jgi:hypothetical protein